MRKYRNPRISITKKLSLSTALTSMLALIMTLDILVYQGQLMVSREWLTMATGVFIILAYFFSEIFVIYTREWYRIKKKERELKRVITE